MSFFAVRASSIEEKKKQGLVPLNHKDEVEVGMIKELNSQALRSVNKSRREQKESLEPMEEMLKQLRALKYSPGVAVDEMRTEKSMTSKDLFAEGGRRARP